jgi:hypothetical protein
MKTHNQKNYVLIGIFVFMILILLFFIFIMMPIGKPIKVQQSDKIANIVKDGDVICRLGDRFWSQFFKDVSVVDRRYSHTGIIHINNGIITVINAEGDTGHGRDFVNEITLENFLKIARTVGIYRIRNIDGNQISKLAMEYIGVPFDWQFDLCDESKLYCTELLYVLLKRLSPNLKLNTIYIKEIDKEIIPLEAISMSEHFSEIYFVGGNE